MSPLSFGPYILCPQKPSILVLLGRKHYALLYCSFLREKCPLLLLKAELRHGGPFYLNFFFSIMYDFSTYLYYTENHWNISPNTTRPQITWFLYYRKMCNKKINAKSAYSPWKVSRYADFFVEISESLRKIWVHISKCFGPNSKPCICRVSTSRGRVSQGLAVVVMFYIFGLVYSY